MQCHSVDTLGLMARTLDDIALFRGAVLALPPVPIERDVSAPRIGFCRTPTWQEAEPDAQELLEKMASKLGAKEVGFAPQFDDILEDHGAITGWESLRNYADERLRNPDKVSGELMAVMKKSEGITLERYVAAQRKTVAFKAFIDSLFDTFDVLVCPSAPGEAPKALGFTGDPRFNSSWTLAGTPCVTLPLATGDMGLPLGVQLVGLRHADDKLLSTAHWVLRHA
jgi:amidase